MKTAIVAIILALCATVFMTTKQPKKLSQQQLLERFKEIQSIIGSTQEVAQVKRPSSTRSAVYKKVWPRVRVRSKHLRVSLDPTSGGVLGLMVRLPFPHERTKRIKRDEAVEIAANYITKFGADIPGSNYVLTAKREQFPGYGWEEQCQNTNDKRLYAWDVAWEKEVDGYPFPQDFVALTIRAQGGALHLYSDHRTTFSSADGPVAGEDGANEEMMGGIKTEPIISEKDALEEAVDHMGAHAKRVHGRDWGIYTIQATNGLQVMFPNEGFSGKPYKYADPRLAYEFDVEFAWYGTNEINYGLGPETVYIDALNGDVIGGWQ